MTDYTTVVSNTLQEVHMISGDYQTFIYEINNEDGTPIDLQAGVCRVEIFRYGDPSYIFETLYGTILENGGYYNQFTTNFSGSGVSGVFQQQLKIVDSHGRLHIPAQGKIIIFPSPDIYSTAVE